MGRRFLPLACVLVLFPFPALGSSQWTEVRSPHFKVLSDSGDKQARDAALHFEQMRAIFAVMFHQKTLNAPVPLEIVVFRSQDEFIRYVPLANRKPVSLTGFLQRSDDQDYIGIDVSASEPYHDAFREYAPLLLRRNFPVTPPWFEEGFADYFAAIQVTGDQVQYGAAPPEYAALLAHGQWIPISTLFSAQPGPGLTDPMFRAEAWLAVHYLLADDRLASAFNYLHLAQIQHVPVADAIQQAFGVDAPTFEKNLRASLPAQTSRGPLPDLNVEPYPVDKVDDSDAQAMLADIHAHSKDYNSQALGEFQAVLKSAPANELANRGLGYWYLRNGQLGLAQPAFQKALDANPNDAQLHYLMAYLLSRKALKEGLTPEQTMAMYQHLERALQIDPRLADAHDLLALALASSGKYDRAIESEKQAVELSPGDEQHQLNLAEIYVKAERFDDAEAVLKRIQTSDNPQIRDSATQQLAALSATREKAAEHRKVAAMGISDPTAPQWKMTPDIQAEDAQPAHEDTDKPDTRKTLYLHGELKSVDCSRNPVAIVTVREGGKLLRLRTSDYSKLLVMGADEFSCGWRDKRVLINYKPGGRSDGDLVTLEIEQGQ